MFLGGLRWFTPYSITREKFILAFEALSFGIFLSNLDSRQLTTSLRTLFGQFWHMSILVTPGPFEYFCQNWVPSENQNFLDEGVTRLWCVLGVLGGQVPRLYSCTIFTYQVFKYRPSLTQKIWDFSLSFFPFFKIFFCFLQILD